MAEERGKQPRECLHGGLGGASEPAFGQAGSIPPSLNGICVFADCSEGRVEPVFSELLSAAHGIAETTKEPIQALLVAESIAGPLEDLKSMDVDEIYAVETSGVSELGDDSRSAVVAEMLRRVSPSCVLIPANDAGRSLFPRVAVKLNTGLTADCTELIAERRESGYVIRQNKPSFGGNVLVSIVHREGHLPQLMTLREGVCKPHREARKKQEKQPQKPQVRIFQDILVPESVVSLLEVLPRGEEAGDILAADVVVVAGRGALKDGELDALRDLAEKIGGALGGTRPLADEGLIPFENQIGQTGRTIRPEICLSFGVSGAIQHVEGIKDTKLFIAVNNDPNAPIFHAADYGVVADMKEIIKALIEQ
ncbi:MAG: electron transfer flavoprotein subunit alpha/FixB family protein [Synergistaceae bacterium]|jgi:electron transfer flavoprotein alpha subunit|nr:electron transfer flavoprotein subunit alpha/FixB family protein [Synergistaceae bacterium]